MEKQDLRRLQQLSDVVGQFIRYWGFRKVHGQIWTLVYLSQKPLSGVEIGRILKVSKALVSPALKELEAEGLIFNVPSENSKTKRYEAEEDVGKIIQQVLSRREVPMMNEIQISFQELEQSKSSTDNLREDRLKNMGTMIQLAQLALLGLVSGQGPWG